MAVAVLAGAGAVGISACQSATQVSYTGRELARTATSEQVALLAGRTPPDGYSILGVVTARCSTLDGATGLLEDPCSEEILTKRARERAAEAGATALLDLSCRRVETERVSERSDAGVVITRVRQNLTCQATALRHEGRRPEIAVGQPGGRTLTIAGVAIEMAFEPAAAPHEREPSARAVEEVAELERSPADHPPLGHVTASCLAGCARNSVWLAIRSEAARLGAVAFAELTCDLDDDRWSCRALLVAAPPPAAVTNDASSPEGEAGAGPDGPSPDSQR
jgi:hypothetical protein